MAVPEQLISSTYTLPAQLSCFRMQAVNQFVFVAKSVLELQVWPQHSGSISTELSTHAHTTVHVSQAPVPTAWI